MCMIFIFARRRMHSLCIYGILLLKYPRWLSVLSFVSCFLIDRAFLPLSSHFAVHSDGGLTDMSLNRDSAFLVEDRYVEWRYMNRTFTMTTDGVG